MTEPHSITALIDLWPARRDLAADIGVAAERVHKWAQTNAIPAKFHYRVVTAAVARGFPVTPDLMVRLHDPSPDSQRAA
jgi:hypothetical protein